MMKKAIADTITELQDHYDGTYLLHDLVEKKYPDEAFLFHVLHTQTSDMIALCITLYEIVDLFTDNATPENIAHNNSLKPLLRTCIQAIKLKVTYATEFFKELNLHSHLTGLGFDNYICYMKLCEKINEELCPYILYLDRF